MASDKYLRDLVVNFMIAGRDTTASGLSWTIYELCQHPQVRSFSFSFSFSFLFISYPSLFLCFRL